MKNPAPLRSLLALAACAALLSACGGSEDPVFASADDHPVVIGHRGASGYLPEHTLESYALAMELGADIVEPDLVSTRDGVLIARHEPMLDGTTDVADHPEFASRRRTVLLDGESVTGFFASDFTLAEIRTLRARQAFSERDQSHNDAYLIPTFDEVLALVQKTAKAQGRTIGVYPETKHPTWHQAQDLPLEDKLLASLTAVGWNRADAPVFIQSFEQANLKALNAKTDVRLVQLVDAYDVNPKDGSIDTDVAGRGYSAYDQPYDWVVAGRSGTYGTLLTPTGLAEVKTYADAIGPWKRYIVTVKGTLDDSGNLVDVNGDGRINDADFEAVPNSTLMAHAKSAGLLVHTWTFRNESRRLARTYANDPAKEYQQFLDLGVMGLFSDFPDSAVAARDAWLRAR